MRIKPPFCNPMQEGQINLYPSSSLELHPTPPRNTLARTKTYQSQCQSIAMITQPSTIISARGTFDVAMETDAKQR